MPHMSYLIDDQDDPRKYNDGDITDYTGLIIRNKLGGFKAVSGTQESKFLLARTFHYEADKEYLVAVTGAIDTAGEALPIDYFFDKAHQIRSSLAEALDTIISRLHLLDKRQDSILREQLRQWFPEQVCDDEFRNNLFSKLKEANFDKAALEDRVREAEGQIQRRDVFEEIMSEMLKAERCYAKIVFPYNITQVHWLSGEIKITKIDNNYNIDIYAHDPYGGGIMPHENYEKIKHTIEKRIHDEDPNAIVSCTNRMSSYTRRQQTGDGVSCGIITSDDIIKLIQCQSLNIETPHDYGGLSLREEHVKEVQANGTDTQKERFSRQFAAAKRAIDAKVLPPLITKLQKEGIGLEAKDKDKLIDLIQGIHTQEIKESIIRALINSALYRAKNGSYLAALQLTVEEGIAVLNSQGIVINGKDIAAINDIHRILFNRSRIIERDVDDIYQLALTSFRIKTDISLIQQNSSGHEEIGAAGSIPSLRQDFAFTAIGNAIDLQKSQQSPHADGQQLLAESEERAELEEQKKKLQIANEKLKQEIILLQKAIATDEQIILTSLAACSIQDAELNITDLKKRIAAFTSGEDKARESQRLAERALKQKKRYQEFNILSKIEQIQEVRNQLLDKIEVLKKENDLLEQEKLEAEKKLTKYEAKHKKAQEAEQEQLKRKASKEDERAARTQEQLQFEAQGRALATNFAEIERNLAAERANVRPFTISTKSCEWHVNGYLDAYIKIDGHSVGSVGRGINIAIIDKYNGQCRGRFGSFDTCGDPGASGRAIEFIKRYYKSNDLLVAVSADEMSTHGAEIAGYLNRFGASAPRAWRQAWCFIQEREPVHSSPSHDQCKKIALDHVVNKVAEVHADVESKRQREKAKFDADAQHLEALAKAKREEVLKLGQETSIINSEIQNSKLLQEVNSKAVQEQKDILDRLTGEIETKKSLIQSYTSLGEKYDNQLQFLNKQKDDIGRNLDTTGLSEETALEISREELTQVSGQLKENKSKLVQHERDLFENTLQLAEVAKKLQDVQGYLQRKRKAEEAKRNKIEVAFKERLAQKKLEKAREATYTHLELLVSDKVLTGYDTPSLKTPVQKIIAGLLPHIFNQYAQYYLDENGNQELPDDFNKHVESILNRCKKTIERNKVDGFDIDSLKEVDQFLLDLVIRAVNEEFVSDDTQLRVTLMQPNSAAPLVAADSSSPGCSSIIEVTLQQYGNDFLSHSASSTVFSPYSYAHKMLASLALDDKEMLSSFLREELGEHLKGEFESCPVEDLIKIYNELDLKIGQAKSFKDLAECIFIKKGEYTHRSAKLAAAVLQKLCNYCGGCCLIKMSTDPTTESFEIVEKLLNGKDAVILFSNELFYINRTTQKIEKINISESNIDEVNRLRLKFIDPYQLADSEGLALITSLTGRNLSERQVNKLLDFAKLSIAKDLLATVQQEIERQKAEETAKLEYTEDPIKKLEKLIALKEKEIGSLLEGVAAKAINIEVTEEEIKAIEADIELINESYSKQQDDIKADIQIAEEKYHELDAALQKLEALGEKDKAQIAAVKAEREVQAEALTRLKEQEKVIIAEYEAAIKERTAYQRDENTVKGELDSIDKERKEVESWKKEEEEKLSVIKTLFSFAKEIHERFIKKETKAVFAYRHDLLAKIQELELASGDHSTRLAAIFDYLIGLDGLRDLNNYGEWENQKAAKLMPVREAINKCDMFLFSEVLGIIQECIEPPKVKWVHVENRCEVTGFNISTKDALLKLQKEVKALLFPLGLSINSSGKISVRNGTGFVGFANFPDRLKKLIEARIEVKYLSKNGHWSEKEAQGTDAKNIFENLEIDYFDVLKSYVDYVEIIAGNDVHVEENINLPGISLTIQAAKDIYTPENLEIITSGKKAIDFTHDTARAGSDYRKQKRTDKPDIDAKLDTMGLSKDKGDGPFGIFKTIREQFRKLFEEQYGPDYREDGWPEGTPGDEGWNGLPGGNAGDICLKAGGEIENLTRIKFKAKGGDGAAGQKGGEGDEGKTGFDTPDALVNDTAGVGRRQLNISWARIPGRDKNGNMTITDEIGGQGGNAGLSGLGGQGGQGGEVIIEDKEHIIKLSDNLSIVGDVGNKEEFRKNILVSYGKRGDDAGISEGGKGGEPGRQGCDIQLFKPSFWRGTKTYKGRLDPKIIENPEGGSRTFWDLDFSIFGSSVKKLEYCDFYRYQINVDGRGDEQPMFLDEHGVKHNEKRDERARGKKGSCNRDRKQKEESRRKEGKTVNIATQAAHQMYLSKKTQDLSKTARWEECKDRCEKKITRIETEIRGYEARIAACEVAAQQKNAKLQEIASKLQDVSARVTKLESKKADIRQTIEQIGDTVNSLDAMYVEQMEAFAQMQGKISEARLAFESAKIDKQSQYELQECFKTIYTTISQALEISKSVQDKILGQHKLEHLQAMESLKIAQAELANLQSELGSTTAEKDSAEKKQKRLDWTLQQLKNGQTKLAEQIQKIEEIQLLTDYKLGTKKGLLPGFSRTLARSKDALTISRTKSKFINYNIHDTFATRFHASSLYTGVFNLSGRLFSSSASNTTNPVHIAEARRLASEYASGFFKNEKDRVLQLLERGVIDQYTADDRLAKIEFCLFCTVHDRDRNISEKINFIKDRIRNNLAEEYQRFLDQFKKCEMRSAIPTLSVVDIQKLSITDLQLDTPYISNTPSKLTLLIKIYNTREEEKKINLLQQLIVDHYPEIFSDFNEKCKVDKIANDLNAFFNYATETYKLLISEEHKSEKASQLEELLGIATSFYINSTNKSLQGLYYLVTQYCAETEKIIQKGGNVLCLAEGNFANFIELIHLELGRWDLSNISEDELTALSKIVKLIEETRIKYQGYTRISTSVFNLTRAPDWQTVSGQLNKKLINYDTETRDMVRGNVYRLYTECLLGKKSWDIFTTFFDRMQLAQASVELQMLCFEQLSQTQDSFIQFQNLTRIKAELTKIFPTINITDLNLTSTFQAFVSSVDAQKNGSFDDYIKFITLYTEFVENDFSLELADIDVLYNSLIQMASKFSIKDKNVHERNKVLNALSQVEAIFEKQYQRLLCLKFKLDLSQKDHLAISAAINTAVNSRIKSMHLSKRDIIARKKAFYDNLLAAADLHKFSGNLPRLMYYLENTSIVSEPGAITPELRSSLEKIYCCTEQEQELYFERLILEIASKSAQIEEGIDGGDNPQPDASQTLDTEHLASKLSQEQVDAHIKALAHLIGCHKHLLNLQQQEASIAVKTIEHSIIELIKRQYLSLLKIGQIKSIKSCTSISEKYKVFVDLCAELQKVFLDRALTAHDKQILDQNMIPVVHSIMKELKLNNTDIMDYLRQNTTSTSKEGNLEDSQRILLRSLFSLLDWEHLESEQNEKQLATDFSLLEERIQLLMKHNYRSDNVMGSSGKEVLEQEELFIRKAILKKQIDKSLAYIQKLKEKYPQVVNSHDVFSSYEMVIRLLSLTTLEGKSTYQNLSKVNEKLNKLSALLEKNIEDEDKIKELLTEAATLKMDLIKQQKIDLLNKLNLPTDVEAIKSVYELVLEWVRKNYKQDNFDLNTVSLLQQFLLCFEFGVRQGILELNPLQAEKIEQCIFALNECLIEESSAQPEKVELRNFIVEFTQKFQLILQHKYVSEIEQSFTVIAEDLQTTRALFNALDKEKTKYEETVKELSSKDLRDNKLHFIKLLLSHLVYYQPEYKPASAQRDEETLVYLVNQQAIKKLAVSNLFLAEVTSSKNEFSKSLKELHDLIQKQQPLLDRQKLMVFQSELFSTWKETMNLALERMAEQEWSGPLESFIKDTNHMLQRIFFDDKETQYKLAEFAEEVARNARILERLDRDNKNLPLLDQLAEKLRMAAYKENGYYLIPMMYEQFIKNLGLDTPLQTLNRIKEYCKQAITKVFARVAVYNENSWTCDSFIKKLKSKLTSKRLTDNSEELYTQITGLFEQESLDIKCIEGLELMDTDFLFKAFGKFKESLGNKKQSELLLKKIFICLHELKIDEPAFKTIDQFAKAICEFQLKPDQSSPVINKYLDLIAHTLTEYYRNELSKLSATDTFKLIIGRLTESNVVATTDLPTKEQLIYYSNLYEALAAKQSITEGPIDVKQTLHKFAFKLVERRLGLTKEEIGPSLRSLLSKQITNNNDQEAKNNLKLFITLVPFLPESIISLDAINIKQLISSALQKTTDAEQKLLAIQASYVGIRALCRKVLSNPADAPIANRLEKYIDNIFLELKLLIVSSSSAMSESSHPLNLEYVMGQFSSITEFLQGYVNTEGCDLLNQLLECWAIKIPARSSHDSKKQSLGATVDKSASEVKLYRLFNTVETAYAKRLKIEQVYAIMLRNNPNVWEECFKEAYWQQIKKHFLIEKVKFTNGSEKLRALGACLTRRDALDIERLLNDFQSTDNFEKAIILAKRIKEKMELIKQANPVLANNTLLLEFMQEVELVQSFELQLAMSHSVAKDKKEVLGWLTCLDHIKANCESFTIEDIKQILLTLQSFDDLNIAYDLIKITPDSKIVNILLLYRFKKAILMAVPSSKELETFLESDRTFESVIFESTDGRRCLNLLTNALISSIKDDTKYFRMAELKELIKYLLETKAYQNSKLLEELQDKPIAYWILHLKRQRIKDLLSLSQDGTLQTAIVDCLLRIEKEKGKDIILKIVDLIRKQEEINLNKLLPILRRFANNRWHADAAVLVQLEGRTITEWVTILSKLMDDKKLGLEHAKKDQQRNTKEIVSCMLQETSTINRGVKSQIHQGIDYETFVKLKASAFGFEHEDFKDKSILELKVAQIEKKHESFKNYNETHIKVWAEEFKKAGRNNLKHPERVIEFLAIMIRAVELLDKHEPLEEQRHRPRYTQLVAMLCFLDSMEKRTGRLANIATGEGKSLITRMLAIARALNGEKVDVLTSSRVLAKRDAEEAQALLGLFGVSVGTNCDDACENDEQLRKSRYQNCQVVYGEAGAFQKDFLLSKYMEKGIRPQFLGNSLIVDEVDSMFIDNAERILYISHSIEDLGNLRELFMIIWSAVKNPEANEPTDKNIDKVVEFIKKQIDEQAIKVPGGSVMSEFINRRLKVWVRNAYIARDMQEGDQYVIANMGDKKGQAMVMDLATGTEQPNTQWSNGLHQFIQIKRFNKLTDESLKAVFMSNMTFFKSYYSNINGMTGTLGGNSERQFLADTYGLDFFKLPRFREERYVQELGIVVPSIDTWKKAIVQDVAEKMDSHRDIEPAEIKAAEDDIKAIPEQLEALRREINSKFGSNLVKIDKADLTPEQEIEELRKQLDETAKSAHEKKEIEIKSIEGELQELEAKLARHLVQKIMPQEEHDAYTKKLHASLEQIQKIAVEQKDEIELGEKSKEHKEKLAKIEQKKYDLEKELEIHNQTLTPEKSLEIRTHLLNKQKEKLQVLETTRADSTSKAQAVEKIKKELAELTINLEGNKAIVANKAARAVLIICENQLSARTLFDDLKQQYPNKVYKYDSAFGKLPLEKVGPGDIIVATNIAGRGTDLETTKLLEKNGGLHVILSYMPGNVRIEAQAFGRTARKGQEGTGKYIVCDHKAASLPLSIEFLCDERDQNEAQRLDTIIRTKLPRILLEEKLFEKFAFLQDLIRKQLREKSSEEDFIQLQIKSLQDRWAFWLDKNSKAIDDVYKDGETNILQLYNDFERSAKQDLAHDEYGLINSPGELLKLAKHYITKEDNKESYAAAERCYDKIIAQDPNFSAFAHYYKVMCIFGQGSTFADKQRARKSLKEAVRLFEDNLARLSTCLQIVKVIGDEKQKSGQGQEVDFFSQSITNQMCFINVHLEAAKEVLGQELSVKSFTNGAIVGEDSKKVFANIRRHSNIIKDKRVSKKLEFKWEINIPKKIDWSGVPISGALKDRLLECKNKSFLCGSLSPEDAKVLNQHGITFYKTVIRGQNKLQITSQFASYRDSIVAALEEEAKLRKTNDRKSIDFDKFSKFNLSKQTFKEYLDPLIDKSTIYQLHKEVKKHSKGEQFWKDAVFKDSGLAIKAKILTIVKSIDETELNELIASTLKEEYRTPENIKPIINKLKDLIISEEKGYRFTELTKKRLSTISRGIKIYLDTPIKTIEKLDFDHYRSLKEKSS